MCPKLNINCTGCNAPKTINSQDFEKEPQLIFCNCGNIDEYTPEDVNKMLATLKKPRKKRGKNVNNLNLF